jgi:hypothetical protein
MFCFREISFLTSFVIGAEDVEVEEDVEREGEEDVEDEAEEEMGTGLAGGVLGEVFAGNLGEDFEEAGESGFFSLVFFFSSTFFFSDTVSNFDFVVLFNLFSLLNLFNLFSLSNLSIFVDLLSLVSRCRINSRPTLVRDFNAKAVMSSSLRIACQPKMESSLASDPSFLAVNKLSSFEIATVISV